uniref:Uncharacterized protein n=1 Tax=Knipowitschia caucasica TaxID=637954 RepID=A0AAV2LSB6_KNICA
MGTPELALYVHRNSVCYKSVIVFTRTSTEVSKALKQLYSKQIRAGCSLQTTDCGTWSSTTHCCPPQGMLKLEVLGLV